MKDVKFSRNLHWIKKEKFHFKKSLIHRWYWCSGDCTQVLSVLHDNMQNKLFKKPNFHIFNENDIYIYEQNLQLDELVSVILTRQYVRNSIYKLHVKESPWWKCTNCITKVPLMKVHERQIDSWMHN